MNPGPRPPPPRYTLQIDHLHHPALLYPVDGVDVVLDLEPDERGLRMKIADAHWAGVMLDGDVDWAFRPERRVVITLEAERDPDAATERPAAAPASEPDGAWLAGHFQAGPAVGRRWRQRSAAGSLGTSPQYRSYLAA